MLDLCCFLDSRGNGITWVHAPSCTGMGLAHGSARPPESGCAKRYAALSTDKGFVCKLRMAFREQLGKGRNGTPLRKRKPLLVRANRILPYIRYRGANKVGVPVKQAAPMLAHILAQ